MAAPKSPAWQGDPHSQSCPLRPGRAHSRSPRKGLDVVLSALANPVPKTQPTVQTLLFPPIDYFPVLTLGTRAPRPPGVKPESRGTTAMSLSAAQDDPIGHTNHASWFSAASPGLSVPLCLATDPPPHSPLSHLVFCSLFVLWVPGKQGAGGKVLN